MVDTDRVVGGAKELGGKVQAAVGDTVGLGRDSVEGRYREVEGRVQDTYGQAKESLGQARDRARDIADDARGRAEEAYGQARERVRGVADDVHDYVGDAYDRSGTYIRDGRQAVSSRVEESPFLALLIAGAVGYGLALLLHGRR